MAKAQRNLRTTFLLLVEAWRVYIGEHVLQLLSIEKHKQIHHTIRQINCR